MSTDVNRDLLEQIRNAVELHERTAENERAARELRDQAIVIAYRHSRMTLRQLGKAAGLSQQRVSDIFKKAVRS